MFAESPIKWLVAKIFGPAQKAAAGAGTVDRMLDEFDEYDEASPTAKQVRTSIAPKINPWVYASIRKIATCSGVVPIQVVTYQDTKGARPESVPAPDHPAWDIIDNPNPHQSWAQFTEACVWQLYTWGRLFIELVRSGKNGTSGDVVALYVLRSRYMTVKPDKKNLVSEYEYSPNNEAQRIPPENVCFIKFYDADSDLKGMSPLEAAKGTLDIDSDARDHAAAAFGNDATPGLILESKDPLDQPVINRAYRNLAKWNAGPRNAKKPLIIGGMTAKSITPSLRDMEFTELRKADREELAAVFDVPPLKNGILDYASFSNAKEQNKQFWMECIRPVIVLICDGLNRAWIQPQYGEDVALQPDLSQFISDPEEKARNEGQALALWGGDLITKNEARSRIGLKPIEDPTGEQFKSQTARPAAPPFSPGGLIPPGGGAAVAGARPPIPGSEDEQKSKDAPGGAREKPFRKRRFDPEDIDAILKARDDAALTNEAPLQRIIEGVFARQQKRVMGLVEDRIRAEKAIAKAPEGSKEKERQRILRQLQLALDEEMDRSSREIESALRKALGDGAVAARDQIGFDLDFNLYDPRVTKYVEAKYMKIREQVNDTTRQRITDAVVQGMEQGKPTRDIEADIAAAFGEEGSGRSRPELIARTESASAANAGVNESMAQSGVVDKKRWVATEDERTRETHSAADGQTVGVDEPFVVGGSQLMFPGDSSLGAPAEEVIQCRCVTVPVFND